MRMIDPRASVVAKRLSSVKRVVAFCSAKGGVGKTLCTAAAGVALAGSGYRTGILDLDLSGASTHVFLGVAPRLPDEDRGILPLPVTDGLGLMSAALFTGERAFPLRGPGVTDALREMLAVTRWGALDFLLVDMPPGLGDGILDLARLVPTLNAFVISTPDRVSLAVVERLLALLGEMKVTVSGVAANMTRGDAQPVRDMARRHGLPFAGQVPYDGTIEEAIGDPARIAASGVAAAVFVSLRACGLIPDR
jgi:ATP-binding protein involved in chromosome partitioning